MGEDRKRFEGMSPMAQRNQLLHSHSLDLYYGCTVAQSMKLVANRYGEDAVQSMWPTTRQPAQFGGVEDY